MHVAGGEHRQRKDREYGRRLVAVTGVPASEAIVEAPGEDPIPSFGSDVRATKITELSSAVLGAQGRGEAVDNVIIEEQPEPTADVPPVEEVLGQNLLPLAEAESVGHPHLPLLLGSHDHMVGLRHLACGLVPDSRTRTSSDSPS